MLFALKFLFFKDFNRLFP